MVQVRTSTLVVSRGRKTRDTHSATKRGTRPGTNPPSTQNPPPPLSLQDLASKIYFDLPRELRDRIYTFTVQGPYDNNVIVRPRRRALTPSTPPFTLLVREPTGTHSYQWVEDPTPLFFSPERVGASVARELLECYYWTRTFRFSYHAPGLLRTFLDSEGLGLGTGMGMRPRDCVRRVTMQVQPCAEGVGVGSEGEEWEGWRLKGEFPMVVFC